jgi:signal transduction histidine kinase
MTPFLRRLIAPSAARDPADERVRLAALGATLAKINHDLRNTLSTATLAAERLAKVDDPVVSRLLPKLLGTLELATELASVALTMAGKDAPRPAATRFPLHALVAEIAGELADGGKVVNLVPEDAVIEADRALLGGALLQLGCNAAENGAGEVRISLAREQGRVRITVADDGPGLSDAARDKLFTPFLGAGRADRTGLGIVLVREAARAHGGELRLVSTGAAGTTLLVDLPETIAETARFAI